MTLGGLAGWIMLGYSAFLLIELALDLMRSGVRPNFVKAVVWIVIFGIAGLFALRGLGSDPDAIAKELKARMRCASCAFDLRESVAADGSLTRCPECEARWRFTGRGTNA